MVLISIPATILLGRQADLETPHGRMSDELHPTKPLAALAPPRGPRMSSLSSTA